MSYGGRKVTADGRGQADFDALPKHVVDVLTKAKLNWLKNTEIVEILGKYQCFGFQVSGQAPFRPPSGSVFLFDRKTLRFFRKDGYRWRKKADGRTIREAHEKLKVENKDVLNCYYAQSEEADGLQRRCYWLLEGDGSIVLVHYLAGKQGSKHAVADDTTCSTEPAAQSCAVAREKACHVVAAESPFSAASLFPSKTCQSNAPQPQQPQLSHQLSQQPTSDVQAVPDSDNPQANSRDPRITMSKTATSMSPPPARHHCSPYTPPSPYQSSIVLCGKPLTPYKRTASAPTSTSQDYSLSLEEHPEQSPVKRTRSDSTQYVQRNLCGFVSPAQQHSGKSLSASHACFGGDQLVPELQRPTRRYQLGDDPSLCYWQGRHDAADFLPEVARQSLAQPLHASPAGAKRAQQASHDRAVPTMTCNPHSSPGQHASLPRHPSAGSPVLTVQQPSYTGQFPSQQILQPDSGTHLHMHRQLHSQQGQLHSQLGSYSQVHCKLECSSSSSPATYDRSRDPQQYFQSPQQLRGIFSQQPLTPDCRAVVPRRHFSFSSQGSSAPCSRADSPQPLQQAFQEFASGTLPAPRHSLTSLLVAQQQEGLLARKSNCLSPHATAPFETHHMLPSPSPITRLMQEVPVLVADPVGKQIEASSNPQAYSSWTQRMAPHLSPFEATVPHAIGCSAADLHPAANNEFEYLTTDDLPF